MNAQSPGAYGLSALMHAAVVALILFFSFASRSLVQDSPKVFELVAGEGDNYAATAAPALGSAGGVKLQALPVAPVTPEPKAQASPIQPAPEAVPVPTKAAATKPAKPAKPVDLVADLKRVEARREKRLEAKYQKEKEAELAREKAAAKVAHIDAEGIRQGVLGGSTENKVGGAGGKALTREEGTELEAWFSLIKQRISENQAPVEGVSDSLVARVGFSVSGDGSLVHVRILKSSGNSDFDQSVLSACEHTHAIPPRPDGRNEEMELSFHVHEDSSQ